MNYQNKQSKLDSELTQNFAKASNVSSFADQRVSTAVQLNQQRMMHSAHSSNVIQRLSMQEDEPLRGEFESEAPAQLEESAAAKPNNTGLPDNLKSGIENLSGYSMDDVKVHFNSDKPAQLNAHAYAQGADIHVAPGQEQHLPHEAWHVVQQKQGRVQATMQMKAGVPVNDDAGLETEADIMGTRALQMATHSSEYPLSRKNIAQSAIQRVIYKSIPYKKTESVAFIQEAKKDLGDMDETSLTALGAIAAHDESANIPNSDALRAMLTLSLGSDTTSVAPERAKLVNATGNIGNAANITGTVATTLPVVHLTAFTQMQIVESNLQAIEAIPVEHDDIDKTRKNAGEISTAFTTDQNPPPIDVDSSAPKTKKKPSKPWSLAEAITPPLTAIKKFATTFVDAFMKAAYRVHALGSLGAGSGSSEKWHLNIGPIALTRPLAQGNTPEKDGTLWSRPWSPGINQEWINAGTDQELDFHLIVDPTPEIALALFNGDEEAFRKAAKEHSEKESDPSKSYYFRKGTENELTRYGSELVGLMRKGYRLVADDG